MTLKVALSVLLIFSAACYALLGLRLVSSKRAVGSVPVGILFVIIGFWVIGGAIEILSETFTMFSVGRTGHFIGTAFAPIVAYACFREYTGTKTPATTLALMLIIPVLSVLIAATNPYHELMWYGPFTNDAGQFLTHPAEWGPWFLFVHLPYSYALFGAALFTLVSHSSAVASAHRRGLFQLIAVCIGPLVATALYDAGVGSNTISYVPLVFAVMLPVYAWVILGEQVFEFSPLAYETVFQHMQDPVVVLDGQHRIIGLNHTAERMLAVDETQALRTPLADLFGDESPEVFEALETGQPQKMMTSTGRYLHVQVSPIESDLTSARGGQVVMFRDVSDVEKAQMEVRRSEKLLRSLINHTANGIVRFSWTTDASGGMVLRSIFANAAAARFLETDVDDLVDRSATQVVRRAVTGMDEGDIDNVVTRFAAAAESGRSLEVDVRRHNHGPTCWLRVICAPVGDDVAVTIIDVTDSKAKERQMESIAASDPLTGVRNRRGFEHDAATRLTESNDDATGALLFIDLNEFKAINDDFGHETGDQLLKVAAERLKKSLRSTDIIGRPGGDEFVALVPDVTPDIAEKLAKRLAGSLGEPYDIDGKKLVCNASIGLALYPDNASTLTGLLREADQAMYRAKARCRGVRQIHGDDLLEKAI